MVELRTFKHFPQTAECPVCHTHEDSKTVLVQIDGTGDGWIAEAAPVHLSCAVAANFNKAVGVLYRMVEPCTPAEKPAKPKPRRAR